MALGEGDSGGGSLKPIAMSAQGWAQFGLYKYHIDQPNEG